MVQVTSRPDETVEGSAPSNGRLPGPRRRRAGPGPGRRVPRPQHGADPVLPRGAGRLDDLPGRHQLPAHRPGRGQRRRSSGLDNYTQALTDERFRTLAAADPAVRARLGGHRPGRPRLRHRLRAARPARSAAPGGRGVRPAVLDPAQLGRRLPLDRPARPGRRHAQRAARHAGDGLAARPPDAVDRHLQHLAGHRVLDDALRRRAGERAPRRTWRPPGWPARPPGSSCATWCSRASAGTC